MARWALMAIMILANTCGSCWGLQFNGSNRPGEGVAGSKHDLNQYVDLQKDRQQRPCIFCHIPHHSLGDNPATLPLWAHQLSTKHYTVFQGQGAPTGSIQGTDVAVLCLSCHDGSVAVDIHPGSAGSALLTDNGFGGSVIGRNGDLTSEHPMGFNYIELQKEHPADLREPSTRFAGNMVTIADRLGPGGILTCTTCHDAHNKDNVANSHGRSTRNYFLIGDNNGSGLCLTCHNK